MTTVSEARFLGQEAYSSDADRDTDNPFNPITEAQLNAAWASGFREAEANDPFAPQNLAPDSDDEDDDDDCF